MNTMEQELENVLRAASSPTPPAGLKERLLAQVRLPATQRTAPTATIPLGATAWLRRWWPVLAPTAVSVACAVGLGVQQAEIRNLKQAIQDLSSGPAKTGAVATPTVQTNDAAPQADAAARTQQEVARLKDLAARLAAEIAQLEQLRADNTKLRTQLATPAAGFLTPEENKDLALARERAEAINCINNMKQLGLAARCWALDNADISPPHVLEMTNEMATPKILVCPGDHGRTSAKDWTSYTAANCSYEYLAASAPDTEPERVMFRCPIHGHIGLCDGSVQAAVAKRHPEWLVRRNGKLYLDSSAQPAQPAPASQSGTPPSSNPNP
jgi:hypothetical protein